MEYKILKDGFNTETVHNRTCFFCLSFFFFPEFPVFQLFPLKILLVFVTTFQNWITLSFD